MAKPIFGKDDYFKMLDEKLSTPLPPQAPFGASLELTEALRAAIRRKKQFGPYLPRLVPEDFSKS